MHSCNYYSMGYTYVILNLHKLYQANLSVFKEYIYGLYSYRERCKNTEALCVKNQNQNKNIVELSVGLLLIRILGFFSFPGPQKTFFCLFICPQGCISLNTFLTSIPNYATHPHPIL